MASSSETPARSASTVAIRPFITAIAAAVAIAEHRGEDAARLVAEAQRLLERSGLGISDADVDDVKRLDEALGILFDEQAGTYYATSEVGAAIWAHRAPRSWSWR